MALDIDLGLYGCNKHKHCLKNVHGDNMDLIQRKMENNPIS